MYNYTEMFCYKTQNARKVHKNPLTKIKQIGIVTCRTTPADKKLYYKYTV